MKDEKESYLSYITADELENGYKNFPKISKRTQTTLRQNKELSYMKIGGKVVYKKSWIEEYIDKNTFINNGKENE